MSPSSPATALEPTPATAPAGHDARLERLLSQALPAKLRRARELKREPTRSRLATGLADLDRLLAGGLPRGRLLELTGRRSSGRFSIALSALAAATGGGEAAALVDLGGGLDPQLGAAAEIELERLLWVRPRHLKQALIGAELLLGSGFALVVLDLGAPPVPGGRGAQAAWLRLARAAAARGSALLISSPYRVSGTAASGVIEVRQARPLWRGAGARPRLLGGLRPRLVLRKLDERPLERSTEVRLAAAYAGPSHA